MATTTLLPMWRSPTASSCGSRTQRQKGHYDAWDDDDGYATSGSSQSPTRIVQCLNFLAQVERVQVRELSRKRFHEPVYQLDIYLTDEDATENASQKPVATYQIEHTLTEFEQLRDAVIFYTTRDTQSQSQSQSHAAAVGSQTQRAAWDQHHWPRRRFRRFFRRSKLPSEDSLQALLNDTLALSRSQLTVNGDRDEPSEALHHVPALVTRFLVRHELSMDE